MQMNHHILAKATTDSVLRKFKSEEWSCYNNIGKDFFRVTTDASFPSPDAAFFDEANKFLASFEFKPPTETKRGILTGVGQSIAYLQEANISFLVAPERLEDFDLCAFLTDLFKKQIYGKLPTGLIIYENNRPENVRLISEIAPSIDVSTQTNFNNRSVTTSRYWAKHQDLPINLFHLLLHCYFLRKSNSINDDAFKYCWNHYLISETILDDFLPKPIYDCNNEIVMTPAGTKQLLLLEKILKKSADMPFEERRAYIAHEIDTEFPGDNKFQAYKKNFVTFLKHMKVIDSTGNITDSGFKLYHLGLVHGANSKIFIDYFIKEVLTTGHHLDLLLDLDEILRRSSGSFNDVLATLEREYEEKGFIKRNPNRISNSTSTVGFLKYECILWRSLGLISRSSSRLPTINWKLITSICSLPDL